MKLAADARLPPARVPGAAVRCTVFFILPVLVLGVGLRLQQARGPYWASAVDPDYVYLLNGVLTGENRAALYNDHPGAALHHVNAVVLHGTHAAAGQGAFAPDTLVRPELYLRVISTTYLLFCAGAMVYLGLAVGRYSRSALLGVLAQSPCVGSVAVFAALPRVAPEPVLVGLAALVTALVYPGYLCRSPRARLRLATACGVLGGLAVATKLTFLPVLAIPLLMLAGWRARLLFAALTVATFLGLVFSPWVMAGRHIFAFVLRTLTHAGPYGSGDVSTVSLPALAARLGRWLPPLATDEWFAVFAVVAAVACLAWGVRHSIPSQGPRRKAVWKRRLLAAILVAQVLQFLLALRSEQPYTRYLIPALSLAGLEVALAVDLVRASIPMRLKPMGAALLLAVLAGLGVSRAVSVLDSERSSEQGRLHRAALDSALAEQWPHARIIDCSVHSSQAAALWFANSWAGWQFSAALDRLHPGFLFLDRSSWLIWDFRGALADPAAALAGDRAVLLRSPLATPLDSSPHLRRVLTSRDEGIYVLDPAASRRDGPAPGKNTQPPAPPTSGRM